MNAAQRIDKAMRRTEEASAVLLQAAFKLGTHDRGTWQDGNDAREVQAAAREYTAAMRALQRANRSG